MEIKRLKEWKEQLYKKKTRLTKKPGVRKLQFDDSESESCDESQLCDDDSPNGETPYCVRKTLEPKVLKDEERRSLYEEHLNKELESINSINDTNEHWLKLKEAFTETNEIERGTNG
ncbi:hypothetical protein HHI36_003128 [Cryptolaemus montrouzieri]|uniref:Uncharacterized protein n=1 Tax=Cryptolaemus montrouzieri TaxID=559131 RepID=A0ABD2PCJ4_9CUCU